VIFGRNVKRQVSAGLGLLAFSTILSAQLRTERGPRWGGHPLETSKRPHTGRPHVWIRDDFEGPDVQPYRSPGGLYPADIAAAYGMNKLAGDTGGVGVTVAIIEAYDSPYIEADLATFSAHFSLPACTSASGCFTKIVEASGAARPAYNASWEVETSLDVEWLHATAPNAKILLVEALNHNSANLMAGVDYAKLHAAVVSMSWGGPEVNGEAGYDSHFSQPGVVFVASAGDAGGLVEYPASSRNVIAVGGTSLTLNSAGTVASPVVETAWSNSGGGCSVWEAAFSPAIQKAFVPSTCAHRGGPDVAMDADPSSGVAIWVSNPANQYHGWLVAGGTSLACPIWAGLVAVADSMRGADKLLTGPNLLTDLYAAAAGPGYAANYRDIAKGNAGGLSAGAGWDFVTGLGTPQIQDLIPYLVSRSQ
jgi:subtilase family serine protease